MNRSRTSEYVYQRGHMGEENGHNQMIIIGKYGATDVLVGWRTGGTDLDHHDLPPKRKGVIQGNWVGGVDLEYYHHYHKNHLRTDIYIRDDLNGFNQRRRAVTAILENQMVQQLAVKYQELLVHVFLDVNNSYNPLD